ncbi:uncharacterized protein [Procambarus clarkii]|uniref:uncharacterized protein isoform X2 n=1 Tax=Procambarus clarkii TaxID=6728 RepID=UPI0037424B16
MSSSVLVLMVMVIGVAYGMGVNLDEHGANKTKAEWERLWTGVPLARSGSTVGNVVYRIINVNEAEHQCTAICGWSVHQVTAREDFNALTSKCKTLYNKAKVLERLETKVARYCETVCATVMVKIFW